MGTAGLGCSGALIVADVSYAERSTRMLGLVPCGPSAICVSENIVFTSAATEGRLGLRMTTSCWSLYCEVEEMVTMPFEVPLTKND